MADTTEKAALKAADEALKAAEKRATDAEVKAKALEEKAGKLEGDLRSATEFAKDAQSKLALADAAAIEAAEKAAADAEDEKRLPFAEIPTTPVSDSFVQPSNADYSEQMYEQTEPATGELFVLAISKPDEYGNTHWLKNKARTWSGTKDQFKKHFERVNS